MAVGPWGGTRGSVIHSWLLHPLPPLGCASLASSTQRPLLVLTGLAETPYLALDMLS
jgi:hypothetical protein